MSYPAPTPTPVEPLQYANVRMNRRPGILTAIGVLSIVIACLSGLSSCGGVASGVAFLTLRNLTIPVPPTATVTATNVHVAGAQPTVIIGEMPWDVNDSRNGLETLEQARVAEALARVRAINPSRRGHLDLLLSTHGKIMFPALGEKASDAEIARAISAGGMTGDGANWYTIGTGRIEINDRRALYRPSDGSDAVEASTTGQVGQAGLATTPQSSSQRPGAGTGAGAGGAGAGAAAPMPVPIMPFKVDPVASILSITENSLSLILAVVLLIAGIMVMRDSQRARKLHLIYAALKLPLAILGAVATALVSTSMMRSMMPAAGGAAPPTWVGLMQSLFGFGMAVAYPVALMLVLNTRQAKDYYAQGDENRDTQPTSPAS